MAERSKFWSWKNPLRGEFWAAGTPEHRKHPYLYTLNCSRVTVVSLVKADSHITNQFVGYSQNRYPWSS